MRLKYLKLIGNKVRPTEFALFIKWILRIKRKEFPYDKDHQFYIDPISDLGLKIQEAGFYEPEMTNSILEILTPGDTFIDLGANEGFFSVLASVQVGKNGTVISIEPQQRLWEIIIKNYELNNCFNCKLMPYGIDATPGTATIFLYTSLNTGASSLSNKFNFKISFASLRKKIYGHATIKTKTLDEIISEANLNAVKLIKIDIEGYEFQALKGAADSLRKKAIQNLLIEIHPEALATLNQSEALIVEFLSGYGYAAEVIQPNLLLFHS
ncbi:MAG: FkbM family methyltransferase [Elusimicrobiota bacterium]